MRQLSQSVRMARMEADPVNPVDGEPTGQMEDVSQPLLGGMVVPGPYAMGMGPGGVPIPVIVPIPPSSSAPPESIFDRIRREIKTLEQEVTALEGKKRELGQLRAMLAVVEPTQAATVLTLVPESSAYAPPFEASMTIPAPAPVDDDLSPEDAAEVRAYEEWVRGPEANGADG